ncbi:hypothetical protein OEA41_004123 [Lepraria neglecta]|uniref:Glycosyltransferase family 8 protein n=1 Tax=Lepraria neglecta TaxID=209136 RepID=A0AAD9Z5S9_9LECA|nr:hypothetical protein OEA41_004123 [Lepraria neglecta]
MPSFKVVVSMRVAHPVALGRQDLGLILSVGLNFPMPGAMDGSFVAFSHNTLLHKHSTQHDLLARIIFSVVKTKGIAYFIIVAPHGQFIIHESDFSSPSTEQAPYHPRAFIAYLQGYSESNSTASNDEDVYYLGTRVLSYQLMYAPKTRTNTPIPFVVLVTEDVYGRKRARLEQDGAVVIQIEKVVTPKWVSTDHVQWTEQMKKPRVFQLTQYEKILYMDADMLITRRLDSIFEDESTALAPTLPSLHEKSHEAPLPTSYIPSAQMQQRPREHPYPPDKDSAPSSIYNYFCSGFWVGHPSEAVFEYYISVLNIEGRFDTSMMEQSLLNYAHRRDGPMPWRDFDYSWTSTYRTYKEYELGAGALHEKYWREDRGDAWSGQDKLREMWLRDREDMEGFYGAMDGGHGDKNRI